MKPQDFLVGAKEFFAVLVPGAVLTFILLPELPAMLRIKGDGLAIFAFAIAAYAFGSVASMLGGALDWVVDPILDSKLFRQVFSPRLETRETFALKLRREIDGAHGSEEKAKSFWQDYLRLKVSVATVELDRIEASQKLFRSLSAIFLFLLLVDWFAKTSPVPDTIAAWLPALLLVSIAMYAAGRAMFLTILYRLAAASQVGRAGREDQVRAAGTPVSAPDAP